MKNNVSNITTKQQKSKQQEKSSAECLWSNLSQDQQEQVSGGWPKIKWPPKGGIGNEPDM